jgi:hypothetical protein
LFTVFNAILVQAVGGVAFDSRDDQHVRRHLDLGRWQAEQPDADQRAGRGRRRGLREVGKKAAGRLLDGAQHDGFPEVRS